MKNNIPLAILLGVGFAYAQAVFAQEVHTSVSSYSSGNGSSYIYVHSSNNNGQTQYYVNDNGVVHSGTENGSFSITSENGQVKKEVLPPNIPLPKPPQVQKLEAQLQGMREDIGKIQRVTPMPQLEVIHLEQGGLDAIQPPVEVKAIQMRILERIKSIFERFF